jgi:hypothetical protein
VNTKALLVLSISTWVVALAMPLMAETSMLKANVPFGFTVGDRLLPAGEYLIRSDVISSGLLLQGEAPHAAALTLVHCKYLGPINDPATITRLTFDRYGDRYFLSEVDNGYTGTGFTVPMSRTQRELTKTASLQHGEVVVVLAQR